MLCLNVIEYLDDPGGVLNSLRDTLKPDGTLLVLVPNGPRLFGSLDQRLGHKRRYSSRDARQLLGVARFLRGDAPCLQQGRYATLVGLWQVVRVEEHQQAGAEDFDKTVWFWRRIDALLPWPGLSLIVVGRKNSATGQPESSMVRSATAPKYQ